MKNWYLLLLIFIFVQSCTNDSAIDKDFLKESAFSEAEQIELTEFLEAFDDAVCLSQDQKDQRIKKCYHAFFRNFEDNFKNNSSMDTGISEASYAKINSILSTELSKQLWSESKSFTDLESKQVLRTNYTLNTRGRYFRFMNDILSKEQDEIKTIVDQIKKFNEFTPSIYGGIISDHKNFDLKDERVRLFLAIHYFGMVKGKMVG